MLNVLLKKRLILLVLWTLIYLFSFLGETLDEATQKRVPVWATLAYWELRERVGRLFPVSKSDINVFANLPQGSGLCLESLAHCSMTNNESILKTREKIGFGISLFRENNAVWIYNRSKYAIFVNSPTLDPPNARTLSVFKVLPGYSLKIFDYEKARRYKHYHNENPSHDGPFDPNAIRISFAKGWGPKYSRQFITSCPCWLEVLLSPKWRFFVIHPMPWKTKKETNHQWLGKMKRFLKILSTPMTSFRSFILSKIDIKWKGNEMKRLTMSHARLTVEKFEVTLT